MAWEAESITIDSFLHFHRDDSFSLLFLFSHRFLFSPPFSSLHLFPSSSTFFICIQLIQFFDKFKYRLGYGGGYYDRYIYKISKLKKIITIGLAFSFQEINKLPKNNYDKKLDFILTENYIK